MTKALLPAPLFLLVVLLGTGFPLKFDVSSETHFPCGRGAGRIE
jgi:hypothetical protein